MALKECSRCGNRPDSARGGRPARWKRSPKKGRTRGKPHAGLRISSEVLPTRIISGTPSQNRSVASGLRHHTFARSKHSFSSFKAVEEYFAVYDWSCVHAYRTLSNQMFSTQLIDIKRGYVKMSTYRRPSRVGDNLLLYDQCFSPLWLATHRLPIISKD